MSSKECPVRCEHGRTCVRVAGHKPMPHIGYCPVSGRMAAWDNKGKCEGK